DSHKDRDGDALFQLKSDSLPHAHAQTTKTYYKHQVYQGRLLASFQDDAKYEHVGQDTRLQSGKDDQDGRIKEMDIRQKDKKQSQKRQSQARNGKD
ncbi:hypothetical protein Tco_0042722, partial [Tanacetum coccineum]